MKRINKKSNIRINISKAIFLTTFALAVTVPITLPGWADNALPTGYTPSGNVAITTAGNTMKILQNGRVGYIQYNSYNVGSVNTVQYGFDTAGSISINKVIGTNATSYINGNISKSLDPGYTQSGHVLLINPSGIVFGAGANVSLDGFTASTHNNVKLNNESFTTSGVNSSTPLTTVTLSDLSQYGIYVAPTATLTATSNNLNLVSNAIKNDGHLVATAGDVNIANANNITFDTSVSPVTISDTVPYDPTTVNVNGTNATAGIISTGSITGQNVNIKSLYTTATPKDIINLSGIVNATAGDINVDSSDATIFNNTSDYDSTSSNNIIVKAGTNMSASGAINLTTAIENATTNVKAGDVTFNDGTASLYSTITAGNIKINTYAVGYANVQGGTTSFGKYSTINTPGLTIDASAESGAGNAKGGNAIFNAATVYNNANLTIQGTAKAISDSTGKIVTDGVISFYDSTIQSTSGALYIEAHENLDTSSLLFGNNNKISAHDDLSISTSTFSDDSVGISSGSITIGDNNQITSDSSNVSIDASSRGTDGSVTSANAGNVLIGNNNTITAHDFIDIDTSTDIHGGGNARSGSISAGTGNKLQAGSRINIFASSSNETGLATPGSITFADGTSSLYNEISANDIMMDTSAANGMRAGDITLGDHAKLTALDEIDLYANSEVYTGQAANAGNIILYGSNLTSTNIGIYIDSVASGTSVHAGTAGKVNLQGAIFNGINGQNSRVKFFTCSGTFADSDAMSTSQDHDLIVGASYLTKVGARFNGINDSDISIWDDLPDTIDYRPASEPSTQTPVIAPASTLPRYSSMAIGLAAAGIAPTSEDVHHVDQNGSAFFGEKQNNKNASNANSGNLDIQQILVRGQGSIPLIGAGASIEFASNFQPPAAPVVASSGIILSPEVQASNVQAASPAGLPQTSRQPGKGSFSNTPNPNRW